MSTLRSAAILSAAAVLAKLDEALLAQVDLYLRRHLCPPALQATALPAFKYAGTTLPDDAAVDDAAVKKVLPPLVQLYLRAGAQVCSNAAHDKEFRCLDYLMYLDLNTLDDDINKRYRT